MVTLMPHGVFSQAIWSIPTDCRTAFITPLLVEKIEPKTIAMATTEVTFGRKYATRYQLLKRTAELSITAVTIARKIMGKVASAQMMIVLPIEFQKSLSLSRYWYCESPAHSIEPRPSQRWKDR